MASQPTPTLVSERGMFAGGRLTSHTFLRLKNVKECKNGGFSVIQKVEKI